MIHVVGQRLDGLLLVAADDLSAQRLRKLMNLKEMTLRQSIIVLLVGLGMIGWAVLIYYTMLSNT